MRYLAWLLLLLPWIAVHAHDLDDLEARIQALEALIHTHEPVPPPDPGPEPCDGIIDSLGNCIPPGPEPEPEPTPPPEPPVGTLGSRAWTSVADVQDAQSPTLRGKSSPLKGDCDLGAWTRGIDPETTAANETACISPWPPKVYAADVVTVDGKIKVIEGQNFDPDGNLIGGELSQEGARLGVLLPLHRDEFDCDVKDRLYSAIAADLGREWAEGDDLVTVVQNSMRAGCYDTARNAMRVHQWGTLGSTWSRAGGFSFDPVYGHEAVYMQVEIAFSPEFFRVPKGSDTGKLFWISRQPDQVNDYANNLCKDNRAHEIRFGVNPDNLHLRQRSYCGGGYTNKTDEAFQIPKENAGRWYRVTWKWARDHAEMWAVDVATGSQVFNARTRTHHTFPDADGNPNQGRVPIAVDGIRSAYHTGHSSSHEPCDRGSEGVDLSRCTDSPPIWIRNFLVTLEAPAL